MGDGFDTKIEVHRRDPDPHPRLKAQITARLDAIEADVEALSGGPGVPPGHLDPSDAVPMPVEDGVVAGPGDDDEYSRGNHQHELRLPSNLADLAGMSGTGVLVRSGTAIAPTQSPTVTGRVTAGNLKVTGQAGSGERVVLADDTGFNRAEAKAQWETANVSAINVFGQWLTGADSAASGVADGTGAALNTIGFYAGYVVHTRAASPAGPLGAGYQSGRASGSAGVAPYPGYTRASVTLAGPTELTFGGMVYRSAGKAPPTFYLANDTASPANIIGINGYEASGVTKTRLLVGSTFSATELTLPDDTWVHVLFVCDQATDTTRVYLDGVLADTLVEPFTLPDNPNVIFQTGDSMNAGFTAPFAAGFVQDIVLIDGIASAATIAPIAAGEVYTAALIEDGGETSGVTQLHLTDDAGLQVDGLASAQAAAVVPDADGILSARLFSDIHGRGLLAARPAASAGNAGLFFETVDALKRYIYRCAADGSTWTKWPTAFVDDLAINVKSYGAIGDGLTHPLSAASMYDPGTGYASLAAAQVDYPHATDLSNEIDWAAAVSANAAAPDGGLVYFPPTIGEYLWNQPVVITKAVTWKGDGMHAVRVKNTSAEVASMVSVRAFPFQCFGMSFDANNKIYNTLELGRFDLGYGCTGATVEGCRFINNKTRTAISSGFYGLNYETGYGHLQVRFCEFLDGDETGAIMITSGTGVVPYPTGPGKGVEDIDISYNILDNVGGPCVVISNMDNAYVYNRSGTFYRTKFLHNYVKCNFTGTYGAVPAEFIGHENMNGDFNLINGGTRGIGVGARKSQFNGNQFYNQSIYCFEAGPGTEDCVISGNIHIDCATFFKDTSGAGVVEPAAQRVTISGNRIKGTGLSAISAEFCISAGANAPSRGWVVESNTFEDIEYLRGLIRVSGYAGSGGHVVKNNTYVARTEESTWSFCTSGGDDDVIENNLWIRYADFSDLTPYHADFPVAIGFTVTDSVRAKLIKNTIIFTGADTATTGGTIALGSQQAATDTAGVVINGNMVFGDYDYIVGFSSTNATCRFLGNDTSAATGLLNIHANIVAKYTGTVYSGTAAPTTGTWKRFDLMVNETATKGGVWAWWCVTAGTPGTWQPIYAPLLDDIAGTERALLFYTAGLKRAMWRLNSTAESGSDAGSGFEGYVYADNGTTARRWIYVNRTSTGEVLLNTNSPRFYPRTATSLVLWFDAWDINQASAFDWREGNVLRHRWIRAAATADWSWSTYTSGGVLIDTPLTVPNAANGVVVWARPLKFVHATAAAAPGANEVTVGGGTIKMARTTDATAREAVAGDDTRLTNTRTPTAHASSHNAGGADAMAIDAAAATGSLRTIGTAATSACAGNDARLSDARSIAWVSVPASSSATGTAGQAAYDANYLYVCTATDTWARFAKDGGW